MIKKAMILCAGFGKRIRPLTLKSKTTIKNWVMKHYYPIL